MCNNAMKEHKDLDQKILAKEECISFYAKSIPLFEGNVIDKLKSLVHNTDFSELWPHCYIYSQLLDIMEADPANHQVVLPTNKRLKGLSSETAPNAQFLVGYRNVIVEKDGNVSWGLSKSPTHCGRAFVFEIT